MENVTIEKKKRGRPVGSIDPKTIEERKRYCAGQLTKLNSRLEKLYEEINLVKEKVSSFELEIA